MKTRILLIDNYDSFTYNLYDYLIRCGTECTVIRNDEWSRDEFKSFGFDGLVLSPGPKKPIDAGLLMWAVEYFHDKKPILGICLGHQGIGQFFGAELIKARLPMHGKTSFIHHQDVDRGLFAGLPSPFQAMRYHSLILKCLEKTELVVTSQTEQNEIMSLVHQYLPIYGVQFHPESILTPLGLQIIGNWLKIVRKSQPYQDIH